MKAQLPDSVKTHVELINNATCFGSQAHMGAIVFEREGTGFMACFASRPGEVLVVVLFASLMLWLLVCLP